MVDISEFSVPELNHWLRSVVRDAETLQIFQGEYMVILYSASVGFINEKRALQSYSVIVD